MKQLVPVLALVFLCASGVLGEESAPSAEEVRKRLGPFVKPLVISDGGSTNAALVDLGRTLFFERRISRDRDRSCNDCHALDRFGANGDRIQAAREAKTLRRDAPSVYNTARLNLFYWDGRKTDRKSQTADSLLGAHEMGMPDKAAVEKRLRSIKGYLALFDRAFPEATDAKAAVTFDHAVAALNAFGAGLMTPAPIDRFLQGDDAALTETQRTGALLFDQNDCGACHTGTAFGGQMLQKLGVLTPWPHQEDLGYYELTKNPDHKMVFRVQGLRNVEKTAPLLSRRLGALAASGRSTRWPCTSGDAASASTRSRKSKRS